MGNGFHEGELAVQRRAGVGAAAARQVFWKRVITR